MRKEEAVRKSLRPSESVTYNVTQSVTHSTALFLHQEQTVEQVTPPNVVFRANIYDPESGLEFGNKPVKTTL